MNRINASRLAPALLALTTAALAASDVHPTNKWSWGENIGWMNWRDANGAADGVQATPSYLSGYIWAENVGWVHVGAGGGPYTNTDHTDYGVNILPGGDLSGLAWGENIGWINFDTEPELGGFAQHARYDSVAKRLRGYAWGENVGWINLDDPTHFVGINAAPPCPGDVNGDGVVDFTDFSAVLAAYGACVGDGAYNPAADFDGGGCVDFSDFSLVLANYGVDCN